VGVSSVAATREPATRSGTYIIAGLSAWLCGTAAICITAVMILALAQAGWQDAVRVLGAASGPAIVSATEWSVLLVLFALPPAAVVSLAAGVAAAEPAIGGAIGKILNVALRVGPALPSVAIGVAALALVTSDPRLESAARLHPVGAAAIALAMLNLPIMTARIRSVLRVAPRDWRIAATAAGATPATAFFRISLPRAWPGIAGALLSAMGQMLGETAVVAIVLSAFADAPLPVSVHLWQRLAYGSSSVQGGPAAASEALLLVFSIVALRLAARGLQRRRTLTGAHP
jgi:ABC-type phosphate transport system permease subunit